MNKISLPQYNLEDTLLGGQAFIWDKVGNSYYGTTQSSVLKLHQKTKFLHWAASHGVDESYISNYLNLETNPENLEFPEDVHLRKARKKFSNINILKQDFEMTVLQYVISQNNNIPKIRNVVRQLSEKYIQPISKYKFFR